MKKFILSPAAKNDLNNIWNYTVKEWGEAQAERYMRDIKKACFDLAAGNQNSLSAENIKTGYRKSLVGSHIIFLKILDDGTISIIRILHQQMDILNHFS